MSDRSESFRRFHDSYFGSRGYGWEPDTDALLSLDAEERATAERLLIEALSRGDAEAAQGLGVLRSTAAIPALHSALAQPEARLRIQCALALWHLERFPNAARVIIRCMGAGRPAEPVDDEELDADLLEFEQVDAVCALGEIPTPESANALIAALSHPRDLVRANAATALGRLFGQAREISQWQTPLMSRRPEEAAEARDAILAMIDPASIEDPGPIDFTIGFDPLAHEYLIYQEGKNRYHFHPDYSSHPIVVPTGNYLSGMLGKPRTFQDGERDRIVPRIEAFLAREHTTFVVSPLPHRPEPTELTPAVGGKVRLKTIAAPMPDAGTGESHPPRWIVLGLTAVGLLLGSGAGFAIGRFLELLLDMRSPTAWVGLTLGGIIGGTVAWLRWRG